MADGRAVAHFKLVCILIPCWNHGGGGPLQLSVCFSLLYLDLYLTPLEHFVQLVQYTLYIGSSSGPSYQPAEMFRPWWVSKWWWGACKNWTTIIHIDTLLVYWRRRRAIIGTWRVVTRPLVTCRKRFSGSDEFQNDDEEPVKTQSYISPWNNSLGLVVGKTQMSLFTWEGLFVKQFFWAGWLLEGNWNVYLRGMDSQTNWEIWPSCRN